MLTMMDGQVCNAATATSSTMRCYMCGETSQSFNKLSTTKKENPDSLEFGLSTLHARIRFMEFLPHSPKNNPVQKWQAKTATSSFRYESQAPEIFQT